MFDSKRIHDFARKALGVPFVERGRDFNGWDCYGLVIAAYREIAGIHLVDYEYESTRDIRTLARHFGDRATGQLVRFPAVQEMAGAVIFRRGAPVHIGLVIRLAGWRILHVEEGISTCHEPLNRFRIEGFYGPNISAT